MGLAYLAASLRRNGFKVKIIDAVLLRLSMSALYKELESINIGVLGITLISHGYPTTTRFLEFYKAKHPETKIVGGGHFATFAASKILAHTNAFDAIVLGEGEHSFTEYCRVVLRGEQISLKDIAFPGIEIQRSHDRILDMDSLAFPARDCLKLAMSRGAIPSVTASRGCYARCSFCSVPNFYKAQNGPRWMSRSIENIIEELKILQRNFHFSHFMFVDDNFMGPGKKGQQRALEFAEAYAQSGLTMTFHIDCRAMDIYEDVIASLTKCGLRSVFIGIESVSSSDLMLYRKDLRAETNWRAVEIIKRFNLDHTLSMIMFNPDTTEEALLENCRFLRESGYYPRNPMSILNIYEGTELVKTFEQQISGPFWDYRFNFVHESIGEIYRECLRFCKDTLPLERELSHRPDDDAQSRQLVHRLRLFFLEDLTRSIKNEPIESIRTRWWQQVLDLRQRLNSNSALSAAESSFGHERLYLNPLQKETSAASTVAANFCTDPLENFLLN